MYYHACEDKIHMANSQNLSVIRDCDDHNSEDKFHRQITTKKIHELKNTNIKVTSAKKLFFFCHIVIFNVKSFLK